MGQTPRGGNPNADAIELPDACPFKAGLAQSPRRLRGGRMRGMERYRSLFNAIFLGLFMLGGAFVGFCVWGGRISHGPEEHAWWYVQGAVGGAIAGGVIWKLLVEPGDPPIVS